MSDPIDIKALDEYLKGGSDISQRYRELGRKDVPPELDRRVLDEARAAVASGGGRSSRSWLRWSAPVALAASVVLVVTVVIESGVQDDTSFATKAVDEVGQVQEAKLQEKPAEPQLQPPPAQPQFVPEGLPEIIPQATRAPAPASAPPAALTKTEAERSTNVAPEEVRADAKVLRDQSLAASTVAAEQVTIDSREAQLANSQPTPSLAGSHASVQPASARKEVGRAEAQAEADSAADDVSATAVTGNRVRRAPGRTAGPRNTVSGSSARSSETRPAADAEQSDPELWLEEIRNLRRAGKVADADREWQDFRKSFPDFHVADDDIASKKP